MKPLSRISRPIPESGGVYRANYNFVFSDDISDWQRSEMSKSADEARKRYRERNNVPDSSKRIKSENIF